MKPRYTVVDLTTYLPVLHTNDIDAARRGAGKLAWASIEDRRTGRAITRSGY